MALTRDQVEVIRAAVRAREATLDPRQSRGINRLRGLNRVEIKVNQGFNYSARNLHEPGVMSVDEPHDRGGLGEGSSPLSHFLTGVGACLLTQFARISIAENYDLQFTKTDVRGEFRRDLGGGFEHIRCDVYAEGAISKSTVQRLIERAEAHCFVYSTLKHACRMGTVLYVNGREVAKNESDSHADH